jgi:hypothetical protein
MSRALEYIAMMKHETLPLCTRLKNEAIERLESEGGGGNAADPEDVELKEEIKVIGRQLEVAKLNTVTKDVLAVLSNDTVVSLTFARLFYHSALNKMFSPISVPGSGSLVVSLALADRGRVHPGQPQPHVAHCLSAHDDGVCGKVRKGTPRPEGRRLPRNHRRGT